MYTDALELIKFRNELINGGFETTEAFELISAYYDAKLGNYQDSGIVFLANEQDQAELKRQSEQ